MRVNLPRQKQCENGSKMDPKWGFWTQLDPRRWNLGPLEALILLTFSKPRFLVVRLGPAKILFKNSVVTTPKGDALGGEMDVGDVEIGVFQEDVYPCAERIGC